MQTLWAVLTDKMEQHKQLTDSLIIKITNQDYRNKINKIFFPEAISTLGCFALASYILFNLHRFNNWYLLGCGIITVTILILLPILSFKTIHKLKSVNIYDKDLNRALQEYSKAKLQFVFIQKLNFILGAVLMLAILPVIGILIADKDFFKETNIWIWYCVGFPFYYLFARWVFRSYKNIVASAGNMLQQVRELQ